MNGVLGGLRLAVVLDIVDGVDAAAVDQRACLGIFRVGFIQLITGILIHRGRYAALGDGDHRRAVIHPSSAADGKAVGGLFNALNGITDGIFRFLGLAFIFHIIDSEDGAAVHFGTGSGVSRVVRIKLIAGVLIARGGNAAVGNGDECGIVIDPRGAAHRNGIGRLLDALNGVTHSILRILRLRIIRHIVNGDHLIGVGHHGVGGGIDRIKPVAADGLGVGGAEGQHRACFVQHTRTGSGNFAAGGLIHIAERDRTIPLRKGQRTVYVQRISTGLHIVICAVSPCDTVEHHVLHINGSVVLVMEAAGTDSSRHLRQ